MAYFRGEIITEGKKTTRNGTKDSGLTVIAASWQGAIKVHLYHDKGIDKFEIDEIPWEGHGKYRAITKGNLERR